jgi:hypothetical protein
MPHKTTITGAYSSININVYKRNVDKLKKLSRGHFKLTFSLIKSFTSLTLTLWTPFPEQKVSQAVTCTKPPCEEVSQGQNHPSAPSKPHILAWGCNRPKEEAPSTPSNFPTLPSAHVLFNQAHTLHRTQLSSTIRLMHCSTL